LDINIAGLGNKRDSIRSAINLYLLEHEDAIVECAAPTATAKDSADAARKKKKSALDDKQSLLFSVLSAGYLDPLKGDGKKYTRRGHQLECHIIRQCLKEHQDNSGVEAPLKVVMACTAPLVKKRSKRYARDSIDFIGISRDDYGETSAIGIEVKARVSNKRHQEETEHLARIRRLLGGDRTPRQRKQKYFRVSAESPDFTELVDDTHEAVQVLHHAYVYGFESVLLLVGDNHGDVLYGIFVDVPAALESAYGKVLGDIYSVALKWLYKPLEDGELTATAMRLEKKN
jgi:hypothetical protein